MGVEAPRLMGRPNVMTALGAGISNNVQKASSAGPLKHGEYSQATRALGLGAYFLSGCLAINASQFLGAPLYLINEDWYNAWIAFTKQSWGLLTMSMTQSWAPTIMRVSGDKSVRGQLLQSLDGNLLCDFPERLIMIANHQIYTDWLYLWWIGYANGMHGRIYIVLKESLKRIPVIGWGMQFSQFIFLKRNWEKDKPRLASHLQKFNKAGLPMWLMLFPEGTNLAPSTREVSKKWAKKNGIADMQHQLLPRSTGLQFCIQQLRKTTDYVYDCTIAYEGVPRGQYAQDIFTLQASYFGGRPPKSVNMFWRRFAISSIPVDDSKAFELWLRARWHEKDRLIESYHRTGRFPADDGVDKGPDGKTRRGAGFIETEIKPTHWYEFMQVFAPIGLLALVLYSFYGALPKRLWKAMNKRAVKQVVLDRIEAVQQAQIKARAPKQLTGPALKALANSSAVATAQKPPFISTAKSVIGSDAGRSTRTVMTLSTTDSNITSNKPYTGNVVTNGSTVQKDSVNGSTTQNVTPKILPAQKAPTGSVFTNKVVLNGITAEKAPITKSAIRQAHANIAKKQLQKEVLPKIPPKVIHGLKTPVNQATDLQAPTKATTKQQQRTAVVPKVPSKASKAPITSITKPQKQNGVVAKSSAQVPDSQKIANTKPATTQHKANPVKTQQSNGTTPKAPVSTLNDSKTQIQETKFAQAKANPAPKQQQIVKIPKLPPKAPNNQQPPATKPTTVQAIVNPQKQQSTTIKKAVQKNDAVKSKPKNTTIPKLGPKAKT